MSEPTIQPDPEDRDWTFVLEEVCAECGYDAVAVDRADIPLRVRAGSAAFRLALGSPQAADRPAPAVWSKVEYACHVRDMCQIMNARATSMLTEDDPLFQNWDQDASAIEDRYWEQDPATVADELDAAADALASTYAAVAPDAWNRPGRRSNGSQFTVDSLGRYMLHDLEHHVWDVSH
ncbi:MAG TPA: DinB family protein [Jatrophihabitans sp.]|jgi:hypothetical protein